MRILRILSIILLFVFFASFLIHPLYSINQDIGRHLKSGEIIWQTKNVYKTNLFSFTEPDRPFINHHWLSEVAFYGLNNAIGLKGLILFKVAVILLALGLLWASVYRKTGFWPLAISSLVGFMVFIERTDVRPEIFSYLFLAFFIFAIFKSKNESQHKWLWFLPMVQVFWTNMHIYFAIGPIMLFFFVIDRVIEKKIISKSESLNPNKKSFGFWILDLFRNSRLEFRIWLLVIMATLINPNFISGALYPLTVLKNYGYSIVENQNIFFLRDYGISLTAINIFEISLAVLILGFIIAFKNGRKQITFEVLSTIFFTVMAVKMLRNFGLYGLAFIPLVALNLSTVLPLTPFNGVSPQGRRMTVGYITIAIVLVFLTWQNVQADKFGLDIPVGAEKGVQFLRENNISGPVFNNFDVGSFLIWKTFPERKVFVDGRPEAYSVDFFEKIYKPMQMDQKVWEKYSKQYDINYIFFDYHDITPWARTFLARISQDKNWVRTYVDEYVVIFLKR